MITLHLWAIISGGQTGADRGGLLAAERLGLQRGGFAPRGWLTEYGSDPLILRAYGLEECPLPPSGPASRAYATRTAWNVRVSDGTVLFGSPHSAGSVCTLNACHATHRPSLIFDSPLNSDLWPLQSSRLLSWLEQYRIGVLNVAGNRESKYRGIAEGVERFLVMAPQSRLR